MLVDGSKTWRERFEIAKAKDRDLGAVVLSVEPKSSAALAGLASGDLLTQVHRRQIESAKHLLDLVEDRNAVTITFWRGGGTNVAVVAGLETP